MKQAKKYRWYKIAGQLAELNFQENNLAEIEVAGKKICLAKSGDILKACASSCPHAGGNMAQGFLNNNGDIICPLHQYIFSLTTGRDISGEGYFLKIYPVKTDEGAIYIGLEESGIFGWIK